MKPVNNALAAEEQFEKAAAELIDFDKSEDGGNTYHVQTDENGLTAKLMDPRFDLEIEDVWWSGERLCLVVRLWFGKDGDDGGHGAYKPHIPEEDPEKGFHNDPKSWCR